MAADRLRRLGRRLSVVAAADSFRAPRTQRLSVVPSAKWGLERETGFEPATFSLEGLDLLAVSRASGGTCISCPVIVSWVSTYLASPGASGTATKSQF